MAGPEAQALSTQDLLKDRYMSLRMAIDLRNKRFGIGLFALWHSVLLNRGVSPAEGKGLPERCSQRGGKGDAADVRVRPGVPGPHRCYARQRTA